jgi:C4-type Zn-finger protein
MTLSAPPPFIRADAPPKEIKKDERHMLCPECKANVLVVIDSRTIDNVVRRRRKCRACQFKFTTYEVPREVYETTTLAFRPRGQRTPKKDKTT